MKKLGCGKHYEVRLIVSADFMRIAERVSGEQPLIGGLEGYLEALMNTALLGEEERLEEQDIRREQSEGRYRPQVGDPADTVPF